MKRKRFFLITGIAVPLGLCVLLYGLLAFYYRGSFCFGTFGNGIYLTGKTVPELNQELREADTLKELRIIARDGSEESIPLSEIRYQVDFTAPLSRLLANQEPLLWGKNLFGAKSQVLLPVISYDEELLTKKINALSCMKRNSRISVPTVKIENGREGYSLIDTTQDIIDVDKLRNQIQIALEDRDSVLNLSEKNCYLEVEKTPQMLETEALWEKINAFQSFRMRYLFGKDVEIVDKTVVADWIALKEDGSFQFDEMGDLILNPEGIKAYVASLASLYDTVGTMRKFQTTRGDVVEVPGGAYGNQLNQKAEVTYLTKAFLEHNEADRVPEYKKTAFHQGSNDIGNTYIEIDITNQMLYYYEDGSLIVETPVVTGNTSLGRGTPQRVCYVYAKQKNRVLRGANYASHVDFWMPVHGGIGIHDASWRKEYGGEIYKNGGSHGCINTPRDAVVTLFSRVEIGTPVIMFY